MEKQANLNLLKDISKKYSLKLIVLYTYNLTKQTKSKKVRFVYCLKGRGKEKGLIHYYKGKFLAPGCFIVPVKYDKEIQSVFKLWNIPYKRKLMLTN